MDWIEDIGPLLGIVSFVGLALLVFLLIQQAREVRRLREWAGRAPERAILIAEREAEERGVEETSWWEGLRAWGSRTYQSIDRISPVDPKFGAACLVAAVIALVVLIGPIGLLGDDAGDGEEAGQQQAIDPASVRVSVLNGTATADSPAVPELAAKVASKVSRRGYKLSEVTDGPSTEVSVAMFRAGRADEAKQLAEDVRSFLGPVSIERMPDGIENQAGRADVALIIGIDDSRL